MKLIILSILIATFSFAQTRPPDEIATNFTNAATVNAALIKAQAAVTGSGTANQLTYWTGTTTIGSLPTATYPSLTEFARVKGLTSPIMTLLSGKQATLVGSGTGQNIKTINGFALPGTGNIIVVADTTGLWLKVNNIVKSLIIGDMITGTAATIDSMIVDFRKNNYFRLNK